jgi:hypothetical protein
MPLTVTVSTIAEGLRTDCNILGDKKKVVPDNVGVTLKRDVNTSALDKERQADELSKEKSVSMECNISFVGGGGGNSSTDQAACKIGGYYKRNSLS